MDCFDQFNINILLHQCTLAVQPRTTEAIAETGVEIITETSTEMNGKIDTDTSGVCLFGTKLCTEPKIVLDYFETPP